MRRSRKPLWRISATGGSNPPLSAMYFAYILKSLKDGSYYYGSSVSVVNRLKIHNSGKVRYTKGHRPYQILYLEEFDTRTEAFSRELFFKSIDGYNWLKSKGII